MDYARGLRKQEVKSSPTQVLHLMKAFSHFWTRNCRDANGLSYSRLRERLKRLRCEWLLTRGWISWTKSRSRAFCASLRFLVSPKNFRQSGLLFLLLMPRATIY